MEIILCLLIRNPTAGGVERTLGSNCGKSGGFGVPRSGTEREMLLGEPSLREAKQVPQGLIPGRTRTAGPHGIVLGKGSLTITICPALAGRKPQPGKPPSPRVHLLVCPPEPAHRQLCMSSNSQQPLQCGTCPKPPGSGTGDICQGTGLP